MTKESMNAYAKRRMEQKARAEVKKEAMSAPPNTTRMKGKDSAASKGAGPNGWTKGATKKPKGC